MTASPRSGQQARQETRLGAVAAATAFLTGLAANEAMCEQTPSIVPAIAGAVIVGIVIAWIARRAPPAADAVIDPTALREANEKAERAAARLDELERTTASLRHDLRGILSPALLTADRLLSSTDPLALRCANATISAVERANERLTETAPRSTIKRDG